MSLLVIASFVSFLKAAIMFVFIVTAVLLIAIILLQEGKGGGLASAFGGAGAETFGVQTGGVNKLTGWIAGIFMFLAVLYAAIKPGDDDRSVVNTGEETPATAPANPAAGAVPEGTEQPEE